MTIHSDQPIGNDTQIPTAALWLGLTGLIPFIAGTLLVFMGGAGIVAVPQAELFLTAYGAVILSFLGGVRWGLALADPNHAAQARDQAFSVVPSLIGWLALLLPFSSGIGVLAVAFLIQGAWDIKTMRSGGGPQWYGTLRTILTAIVGTLLIAVFARELFA
ncbi:MAG: DUF3429 domain-containing protein [Pseudomonadota bacterium]